MILALAVTAAELAELEDAHLRSLGVGEDPLAGRSPVGSAAGTAAAATAAEARRSLVARGLLTADGSLVGEGGRDRGRVGDEDDVDGAGAEAMLVVRTTLDVRASATCTIVVERLVAAAEPDQVAHGVRLVHLFDGLACVEDVADDGGRHLWLVPDPEEVVGAVVAVTVPGDATSGEGAARRAAAHRPDAMGDLLDGPTVLATLSVVAGDGAISGEHLLALGPRGCWVAHVDSPRGPGGDLDFLPADPGWVARRVRDVQRTGHPAPVGEEGTMAP
ncbi:hypothetical protein [Ornithinimicrobium cerasi]|uniref:EspG family protein n=1 Tax=Ornithinimicrobium cerasi TaxID=2248773 RepID=A0A285VM16_9MICO|nr:hypothetical protein [Ornithinimicrobium cerasi]SOC55125.1 hypothetical protein SAMN05421879_104182 [Ornithinimicrobium cerasi]